MKQLTLMILICMTAGCTSTQEWADFWTMEEESASPASSAPDMNVVDVKADRNRQTGAYNWQEEYAPARASTDNFGAASVMPQYGDGQGVYNGQALTKHIGDYVQNMAQDLISNMEYVSQKTPVGVTHFALIDSDLQKTNLLGFQLAESFVHELHKFRIPVIDYKATEYIRVTDSGDFLLSRDFLELTNEAPIEYILTGTMTRHQGGYLINARILGLKSKAVVASAQMLVPFYVVDALLPSNEGEVDGINLIQG